MEDNFYIILPSNGQEGNTPAHFLTNFNTSFKIDNPHEWEVGLKEISFKNTIKTIHTDSACIQETTMITKDTSTGTLEFYEENFDYTPPKPKTKQNVVFKLPDPQEDVCRSVDNEFEILRGDQGMYLRNNSKHIITFSIPMSMAKQLGFVNSRSPTTETVFKMKNVRPRYSFQGYFPLIIEDNSILYKLFKSEYTIEFHPFPVTKEVAQISPGTYSDPKELENELNKSDTFGKYFKFIYDPRLNRFDVETVTNQNATELHFKNGLQDVLGFSSSIIKAKETTQKGDLEVNLMRGINSLFIYCDCLQSIRVGTLAPLLRTVSFNRKQYGEMVHVNYTNPIYLNLNKCYFDRIDIQICDVVGELIPFVEGLTTVVLHFKRK